MLRRWSVSHCPSKAHWLCNGLSQACVLAGMNTALTQLFVSNCSVNNFIFFKKTTYVCLLIFSIVRKLDKHQRCLQTFYLDGIWCIIMLFFSHLHIFLLFTGCFLAAVFTTRGPFVAANVWL